MDAIDACLIITDGEQFIKEIGSHSLIYEEQFKLLLKGCEWSTWEHNGNLTQTKKDYTNALQRYLVRSQSLSEKSAKKLYQDLCLYFHKEKDKPVTFDQVVHRSTELHAQLIGTLLRETGYKARNVDIVGYHGQTLFHRPSEHITIQVGNGQWLSDHIGISVVHNFRANDVKNGGQGAPFAPLYHKALANQIGLTPVVFANCGGISNVTVIGTRDEDLYAYDCGPGNTLIDRFVQLKINKDMDKDGTYGKKGKVSDTIMQLLRKKSIRTTGGVNYLDIKPPKSLDVNDLKLIPEVKAMNLQDGCATLEAFTAECIIESLDKVPVSIPNLWVLSGGGWKNPVIMRDLEERLKRKLGPHVRLQHADQVGWNSEAMEAQIFAYLAVRSLKKLPLSLPGTTGVGRPITGGEIVMPNRDIKKTTRSVRSFLAKPH
jgi:anhydro-N-acetylmuramic acid kinase